ncbi:MAG: nuclear transport factor 2 family protein [Chloroflexota bacterium]
MAAGTPSPEATKAVLECKRRFWQALQRKDADLLAETLADDFVCRAPGEPDQDRAAFIRAIVGMPLTIARVSAEQVAVQLVDTVAVLTGIQVAQLRLPDGSQAEERLALTNVFR